MMAVELLKNAHTLKGTTRLLCCAANRTARRMSIYASRFGFLRALHLNIFEQPRCFLIILLHGVPFRVALKRSWPNIFYDYAERFSGYKFLSPAKLAAFEIISNR
jgi:hypothetical protein